jgi:ATP-dependent DNA helicase RecQ
MTATYPDDSYPEYYHAGPPGPSDPPPPDAYPYAAGSPPPAAWDPGPPHGALEAHPSPAPSPPDPAAAHRVLREVFGYDRFRGDQEPIIQRLIAGGDALVLMPTGGGKSLCYQIPALLRTGVGVVVSPLIALMQDQVDALRQLGVRAAFLNSTLDYRSSRALEEQMRQGALDLVYVAPERLLTERFLQLLGQTPLALFAIDEAHCVSQWGHDFRPEYIQLAVLHQHFPQVPRVALTATADAPTRAEIVARLQLQQAEVYVSSFNRPNIRYRIVEKANGRRQLLEFLRAEHAQDAGIVYCLSRKRVEETAEFLAANGFTALPYHAGLPSAVRAAHQARFLREESIVMVATIAFGMGIDKPDVRFVAHLDLPKSLEAYYQETGRAGRDGLAADAWLAYGVGDVVMMRRMLADSDADPHHKQVEQHKLGALLGYCETTECRRQVLLRYFGERMEQPCGNCDTCLEPVDTWDASVAAQKAMSCVYRTEQRFGVGYLVDVLRGKDDPRIRRFGHDRVSTFGIGKDLSEKQWRSVFRQLVAAGLLSVDMQGYGGLRLTETSRPVLRGEQPVRLRKDPTPAKRGEQRSRVTRIDFDDPAANALWQALRGLRTSLAEQQGVPPYVIFADASLREMVHYRPRDPEQLGRISGVGATKLERYGDHFLQVLQAHEAEWGRPDDLPPLPERAAPARASAAPAYPDMSETVRTSLDLFLSGTAPEDIAARRGFKPSTIYGHLAKAIEAGELSPEHAVRLEAEERKAIEAAFLALPEDTRFALQPVFEALGGAYDYGTLRCVRAGMRVRGAFPEQT